MGGAGQLAELEIHGGQAVVDVRQVAAQAERLQKELPRSAVVALLHGLLGLLAEALYRLLPHRNNPGWPGKERWAGCGLLPQIILTVLRVPQLQTSGLR